MANYNVSTVYRGVDKASPVMDKMARNALRNSQRMEGSFGRMSSKAGSALGKGALGVAKYAAMAGTATAAYIGKQAVSNYLDFESEMLNVRAITRAGEEDYKSMTNAALGMAKTSVFTGKEVAQGMKYLGMAGWETKNIIAGMPGVLQLAAATQSDLAQTSDMLSDAMTAFRIPAEQAIHVADVFAGTATRTNTNMEQLQEAMKDAAPAAMNFGVSIETTSAMLGVMADNGIKGSRAGTSFKNMTMRLANPTATAAKWLKRMNIEVTDSNGKFRDITDITADLKTGLAGLTQEEQSIAKGAIFGKIAIAGVSAVLADQDGKVEKLTKSFRENIGVAKSMADVQLSGASGAVKKMTSAWDALSITLMQKVAPAMEAVFQHMTSMMTGELGEIGNTIQKGNITVVEEGIKGGLQSPFPTISDERFQRGYRVFRQQERVRAGLPDTRTKKEKLEMESLNARPVTNEDVDGLFKQLYEAELKGSQKRAEELSEKTKEIRSIYDVKLKNEDVRTPMSTLAEKITKQENTLIIKAPKGTVQTEGKVPNYLKLVETY